MSRSTSIPAFFFTTLCLVLTIYLFTVAEGQQHRNILLGAMLAEGLALSWLIWKVAQSEEAQEAAAIPIPRSRSLEVIHCGPTPTPKPRQPHQHRPLLPTRPPARSGNPLPPPLLIPRRTVSLPKAPDLPEPQPGRSNSRPPEPVPRPNTNRPERQTINLDDLLPPAPTPTSFPNPTPRPTPHSEAKPTPQGRPSRPSKYEAFEGDSGDLPSKIAITELKLCSEILRLGYACAASDGPVSTDEDDHLQGWLWRVIDKVSDKDAAAYLEALNETTKLCKSSGKQKLEAVASLADSIRSTGEKKMIQAAAELCREIVTNDGRLEPGEYATLSIALKRLGSRKIKAEEVAVELLSNDQEIAKILRDAKITDKMKPSERVIILSNQWANYNAYTNLRNRPAAELEKYRRAMAVIARLREIYREIGD
jgi:hypothetical protein